MSAIFRAEIANLQRLVKTAQAETSAAAAAIENRNQRTILQLKKVHEAGERSRELIRKFLARRNKLGATSRDISKVTGIGQELVIHYLAGMRKNGEVAGVGKRSKAWVWKLQKE